MKLPLLELHDPAQVGLQHGVVRVDVVAVERHLGFQPQGVPRAEAAGQESDGGPLLHQRVPERRRALGGHVHLEAVLPRVPRPGEERLPPQHLAAREPVVGNRRQVHRGERLEDGRRPGALDGHQRGGVALVLDHRPGRMLPHPGEVLLDVRRIQRHQVAVLGQPVHGEIVHERPGGRGEGGVLHLADLEPRGVVAGEPLQRRQSAGAAELHLAHVRDVEEARRRPHRPVLVQDPPVLDRHVPIAEGNHLRPHRPVQRVERRLF